MFIGHGTYYSLEPHSTSKVVRNLLPALHDSHTRSKLREAKCCCSGGALLNYIESGLIIQKSQSHSPVSSQSAALLFGTGGTTAKPGGYWRGLSRELEAL